MQIYICFQFALLVVRPNWFALYQFLYLGIIVDAIVYVCLRWCVLSEVDIVIITFCAHARARACVRAFVRSCVRACVCVCMLEVMKKKSNL